MRLRPTLLAAGIALAAGPAAAHTGHEAAGGLAAGLLHPLLGPDHLLAMVMVGLWAAQLGGRAVWQVPAAFVAMMAAGAALALAGVALPPVEGMVAVSVLVLGLAVAAAGRLPASGAAALAGLFALFHGAAHGLELPELAGPVPYAVGFLAATAALHTAGLGLGVLAARRSALPARAAGALTAVAGLVLVMP